MCLDSQRILGHILQPAFLQSVFVSGCLAKRAWNVSSVSAAAWFCISAFHTIPSAHHNAVERNAFLES